jgi:hypothetical protein
MSGDHRWTIRFSDKTDRERARALLLMVSRASKTSAGRVLCVAVENFVAATYGESLLKFIIMADRTTKLLTISDERKEMRR